WLESSELYLTATFDQEIALENRTIPFIIPIHPLTKMATKYWTLDSNELLTHIQVNDTSYKPGIYQFAYYLWETVAERTELCLLPLVWNPETNQIDKNLSMQLSHLIKKGSNSPAIISLPPEK